MIEIKLAHFARAKWTVLVVHQYNILLEFSFPRKDLAKLKAKSLYLDLKNIGFDIELIGV